MTFVDGMGYEKPSPTAPKSIIGKLSVSVPRFTEFMNTHKNDRNWVNIDIRYSQEKDKYYMTLNTYNTNLNAEERKKIAEIKVANGLEPVETPDTDDIDLASVPDEVPF